MTEIRVCRKPEVVAFTDGGWPKGLVWAPDTPAHRRELELLVKVGNRLYGEGSHWLEEQNHLPERRELPREVCSRVTSKPNEKSET